MTSVRLVCWREEEGEVRRKVLEGLGYQVDLEIIDPARVLRAVREYPPGVAVIDLSRSPAMGRDFGVALRVHSSTRRVPLVFAGGKEEKVEGVRKILPDAEFADWDGIGAALRRALDSPPKDPVVPASILAGYSGTPLPKKLGIKSGNRVLLAGAPKDFPTTLGSLPEGTKLTTRYSPSVDLILWFVRSKRDLKKGIEKWVERVGKGGIWIIWPKQSSGVATDLRQNTVRRTGLEVGLVDYKVAAVDQTWSGLKFSVRKKQSGTH